ncbi:MAG: ECF-type sigma factor [Planctomycetota bacterium]|nr:ECF-type sigma factor [Planctomycetota bacterium]
MASPDDQGSSSGRDAGGSGGVPPGDDSRTPASELLPLVYNQLRELANHYLAQERSDHTLQATALVHEAYDKLVGRGQQVLWKGEGQFFVAAGEAMRRLLIDHARIKKAAKRGGPSVASRRLPLDVVDLAADAEPDDIAALEDAFCRLSEEEPEVAAVVRLRFYAGLTGDKTAETLGLSPRQVDRLWSYARAYLLGEIERARSAPKPQDPAPGA